MAGQWWPVAAVGGGGSLPAEQLDDLEDILKEPGPDAGLPVSSGSGGQFADEEESPDKAGSLQQGQSVARRGGPAAAASAAVAYGSDGASRGGGWSSYLPTVGTWLPSSLLPAGQAPLQQQQQQPQQQQQQPGPEPHASLWHQYLPALGSQAGAAGSSLTAAVGSVASTATAWTSAATHQLSAATAGVTHQLSATTHQLTAASQQLCEHVTASSVGVSVLGAAVGGIVAGPLGVAVGAKSGAAMVAAGALSGAAVKHARDRRAGSAGSSAASSPRADRGSSAERELQTLGKACAGQAGLARREQQQEQQQAQQQQPE